MSDGGLVLRDATVPVVALADPPLAPPGAETARVDIGVERGIIRSVVPAGGSPSGAGAAEPLAGGMVWPTFVEAHTHLDSSHVWTRTPNPSCDFPGAAAAMISDREHFWTAEDMARRMRFGLACAYGHGVSAMRTHLASQNDQVDRRWEVFREIRDEWAGRVALQGASLIALEALQDDAALEAMARLVQASDGVLGAFAPAAPDLDAQLHRLFAAAERHGLELDFHADETLDAASQVLSAIARVALARRFDAPVTVGHCCSLAVQDEDVADRTLDLVARAGLRVVSLPACNLFLQDRRPGRTPRRRGVTLVHEMRARGIPVAFGGDNVRDPFHAYGDFDMLEVFRDAVRLAHLDAPVRDWPASVLGRSPRRIGEGQPADLVVFRARSFNELLSRPQSDRRIMRGGRWVDAVPPDYAELDGVGEERR